MKYVYIAGPYTQGDVARNVRSAIAAADHLSREEGLIPFIPHLTHFWHMQRPRLYEYWLKYDLAWLEKCDYLMRLDGESPGADKEVKRAFELGMPVFLSVEDCIQNYKLVEDKGA